MTAAPLNYTTSIPVKRTVSEVIDILGQHGAERASVEYTNGDPTGVAFTFQGFDYALPVDVDAMSQVMADAHTAGRLRSNAAKATLLSREQAARIAWRVIKDWLEAQMALVAARQVTLDEVMLPYYLTPTGEPLRVQWNTQRAAALPEGASQ